MSAYPCRVRKYRKAAHLSQSELSMLVGIRSQGVMSEVEAGSRSPSLAVAIACEIVFGVGDDHLFPQLRQQVKRRVLGNARRLQERLRSGRQRHVADYLAALIKRLTNDLS